MEGAAARMGDAVSMSTDALCRGFAQLENLLDVIAQQLRPATEKLRPLAAPLSTIAAEAEAVVEPGGVHADHQRAIAEYIPALMFPLCTGTFNFDHGLSSQTIETAQCSRSTKAQASALLQGPLSASIRPHNTLRSTGILPSFI